MPTLHRQSESSEAHGVLDDAIARYHGQLEEHEVTVALLMVDRDDASVPAIMVRGVGVEARVTITPYKQRVLGVEDAVIEVDAYLWKELDPAGRLALLDRMCWHLDLQLDDEGAVKSDDRGRPMLKVRPPDWRLEGVRVIADRHGDASPEARAFRGVGEEARQLMFGWLQEPAMA